MPDVSTVFDRIVSPTSRAFRIEIRGDDTVTGLVHVEIFTVPPEKDRRISRVMESTTVADVCSAVETASREMGFVMTPTGWTTTDYGATTTSWSRV